MSPKRIAVVLVAILATACGTPPDLASDANSQSPELAEGQQELAEGQQEAVMLPGGKAHWSAVLGWFNTSPGTTAQMRYYTFNTNGTVTAFVWVWDTNSEKGKTAYLNHVSTDYGFAAKTCNTYTPTGWMAPSRQYSTYTGTFTNNGTTVSIAWANGLTEAWFTLQDMGGGLKRLYIKTSNQGITHGRMLGSAASRNVFVPLADIPRKAYGGKTAGEAYGTSVVQIGTGTSPNNWDNSGIDLTSFDLKNSNTLHYLNPNSPPKSPSSCAPGRSTSKGQVFNLVSANQSRAMAYNHWFWCLPPVEDLPCYTRQLHPYALEQIIDDGGNFRGFIGVHQQDEPGSPGYSYTLVDWF